MILSYLSFQLTEHIKRPGHMMLEFQVLAWHVVILFCLINRFIPNVIFTDVFVNITFIWKPTWRSLVLVLILVSIFLLAVTCQLYTKTEQLERDGCVSVANVTYNYCAGGCGDSVNKPMLLPDISQSTESMSKDCSCCTGNINGYQTVKVKCTGYTNELNAKLPVINKCECNKCSETGR